MAGCWAPTVHFRSCLAGTCPARAGEDRPSSLRSILEYHLSKFSKRKTMPKISFGFLHSRGAGYKTHVFVVRVVLRVFSSMGSRTPYQYGMTVLLVRTLRAYLFPLFTHFPECGLGKKSVRRALSASAPREGARLDSDNPSASSCRQLPLPARLGAPTDTDFDSAILIWEKFSSLSAKLWLLGLSEAPASLFVGG